MFLGGTPITSYSIQYSTDNSTWITKDVSGVDITTNVSSPIYSTYISGLTSNTEYWFKMAAVNIVGTGSYSISTSATTLPDPSTAPPPYSIMLNNTNNPGDGKIIISWETTYDGSSPIISYNVRYSTDNSTWTIIPISATDYVQNGNIISGLINGQMYYFQVALENGASVGEYSSSYTTTIPMLPAPTDISTGFHSEDGTITITWTAPQIIPDMPAITDYYVRYSDNSSGPWTQFIHTASTDTTQILTDPSWVVDTTYYFQVAAVQTLSNADGSTILETGTYSASFPGSFSGHIPYEPLPP